MLFVVLFEDIAAGADAVRSQYLPAHLAFLERHAATIRAAGPLRGASGTPGRGLWLVEAGDAAVVQQLVEADPFWAAGLRRHHDILAWHQVFADGQVLVLRP